MHTWNWLLGLIAYRVYSLMMSTFLNISNEKLLKYIITINVYEINIYKDNMGLKRRSTGMLWEHVIWGLQE